MPHVFLKRLLCGRNISAILLWRMVCGLRGGDGRLAGCCAPLQPAVRSSAMRRAAGALAICGATIAVTQALCLSISDLYTRSSAHLFAHALRGKVALSSYAAVELCAEDGAPLIRILPLAYLRRRAFVPALSSLLCWSLRAA